jgi:hypothetical protein
MSEHERSRPTDTLSVVGIILSIFVVVFPVTWRLQCGLLVVANLLIIELAFNSRWTIHLGNRHKRALAFVAVAGFVALSWSPIKLQYQKDQPPDVFPLLAEPKEPVIVLQNESANVAQNIKWGVVIWNVDIPEPNQNPLQIPFQTFDFLRAYQSSAPEQLFTPTILSKVKPGNRLFGYVTAECPECATSRDAWVYIEYGKGGW